KKTIIIWKRVRKGLASMLKKHFISSSFRIPIIIVGFSLSLKLSPSCKSLSIGNYGWRE
ncbi:hypothetical protein ACJX0J_021260, partial [Zea mays]